MRGFPVYVAVVAALLPVLMIGCSHDQPVRDYEPAIAMEDLAKGLPAPDNGYELLSDKQTVGRFACTMAVSRIALVENDFTYELAFTPTPADEQAWWWQRVLGLLPLRGVVFLTHSATVLYGTDLEGLFEAAETMQASLLIVYAPNLVGPNSAQVLGVLYDVPKRRALATFHASSIFYDDDGEESSPQDMEGDQRDSDALFQAKREFEVHVRDCLRELMMLDKAPPATQEHGWETPLQERWWLPMSRMW